MHNMIRCLSTATPACGTTLSSVDPTRARLVLGIILLICSGCGVSQHASGTWVGVATRVDLQDDRGVHVTGVQLTPWSGPRLPPGILVLFESYARAQGGETPDPVRYVLIHPD